MNSGQQSLQQNGLPQNEINALTNAGMSNAFIQAYTNHEAAQSATLNQSSVSISQLFHSFTDQLSSAAGSMQQTVQNQ